MKGPGEITKKFRKLSWLAPVRWTRVRITELTVTSRMAMTDRAGFIYKEGIKVTNWKQRWMVIERIEGRISYYVKENCREKKGEILISTIRGVEEMPGKYKNKPYVFAIHTTKSKGDKEKEGRTYYIHGMSFLMQSSFWFFSFPGACFLLVVFYFLVIFPPFFFFIFRSYFCFVPTSFFSSFLFVLIFYFFFLLFLFLTCISCRRRRSWLLDRSNQSCNTKIKSTWNSCKS